MSFTSSSQDWHAPLPIFSPTTSTSTSSPPTSAPTSTKRPDRKLKLRASCDSCAASKVKCSKEHPICQRCSASGSSCIYGISRKHGKPGRTRKRNPDGTPFIKASKQRPSPDGSEFGKFRIRNETIIPNAYLTPEPEQVNYSSTPEWPATPDFDYSMTPDDLSLYSEPGSYAFMDDLIMGGSQSSIDSYRSQSMDSYVSLDSNLSLESTDCETTFTDPFAKKNSIGLGLSLPQDYRLLKDYVGGSVVHPMSYTLDASTQNSPPNTATTTTTNSTQNYYPPTPSPALSPKNTHSHIHQTPISLPPQHPCPTLAHTTLQSLSLPSTPNSSKPLSSLLSTAKTATETIISLLACPCSSDPHHAMLYSSITAKILTWYRIAAGLRTTDAAAPTSGNTSPALTTSHSRSSSTSSYTSTSSSTTSTTSPYPTSLSPDYSPINLSESTLRRRIVLEDMKRCSELVEALASWRGSGSPADEQAEFLYDVLGAWLKSEVWRTVGEIEGMDGVVAGV